LAGVGVVEVPVGVSGVRRDGYGVALDGADTGRCLHYVDVMVVGVIIEEKALHRGVGASYRAPEGDIGRYGLGSRSVGERNVDGPEIGGHWTSLLSSGSWLTGALSVDLCCRGWMSCLRSCLPC
jgi:hypothetical protein